MKYMYDMYVTSYIIGLVYIILKQWVLPNIYDVIILNDCLLRCLEGMYSLDIIWRMSHK